MTLKITRRRVERLPWWKPLYIPSPKFGKRVLYWLRLMVVLIK